MPYFPPNLPEYNHLRHLYLLGWHPEKPITEEDLSCYVAHLTPKGELDDWFFDSFLVFMTKAPSGNALYNDINIGTTRSGEGDFFAVPSPNPGNAVDWEAALDSQFGPDGVYARLDRTIARLTARLGKPNHRRNVVITIPYPHAHQVAFGPIREKGPRLNFSVVGQNLTQATHHRLEACRWFVDESIRRWKKAAFKNLNLLGFYWVYESLHYAWNVDDHWVLKELHKHIRSRNSRLFWIPFYSSFNVNLLREGKGFYFDAAFLQPNHMFYANIPDVAKAAGEACERGAGIELEYWLLKDPNHVTGREKHQRFYNYLNGGVTHKYMTESACAYFVGFNDVHRMARHRSKIERQLYHDLYHFVKGDYTPKQPMMGS